jgi:curved DNA-binding protein CbpA
MFVDYYAVLETGIDASQEGIRKAYRKMAMRWHPDRNPGVDTVARMQAVNEAYLILNDPEARARYDTEHRLYHSFKASQQSRPKEEKKASEAVPEEQEYVFSDETLERWVRNARRQAADLSRMTRQEFVKGAGAAAEEMGKSLVSYMSIGLVFLVIFALSKGCR